MDGPLPREGAAGGARGEGNVEIAVFLREIAGDVLEAVYDQYISMETVNEGLQFLFISVDSDSNLRWTLRGGRAFCLLSDSCICKRLN